MRGTVVIATYSCLSLRLSLGKFRPSSSPPAWCYLALHEFARHASLFLLIIVVNAERLLGLCLINDTVLLSDFGAQPKVLRSTLPRRAQRPCFVGSVPLRFPSSCLAPVTVEQ